MATRKCDCGYECRLPGEAEALDLYGCARTVVRKVGFGQQIIQCNQNEQIDVGFQEDPDALVEAYKQSKEWQPPKKDDNKKK